MKTWIITLLAAFAFLSYGASSFAGCTRSIYNNTPYTITVSSANNKNSRGTFRCNGKKTCSIFPLQNSISAAATRFTKAHGDTWGQVKFVIRDGGSVIDRGTVYYKANNDCPTWYPNEDGSTHMNLSTPQLIMNFNRDVYNHSKGDIYFTVPYSTHNAQSFYNITNNTNCIIKVTQTLCTYPAWKCNPTYTLRIYPNQAANTKKLPPISGRKNYMYTFQAGCTGYTGKPYYRCAGWTLKNKKWIQKPRSYSCKHIGKQCTIIRGATYTKTSTANIQGPLCNHISNLGKKTHAIVIH